MTPFQRVRSILLGLVMLGFALLFILDHDEDSYRFIVFILAAAMTIKGLKDIFFYCTMGRHMVGGKIILFQGVIIFDLALFTATLSDVPKIYVLLYLIAIHAFSGAVEILRAMEARRTVDGPWKVKFSHGIVNILLALSCLIFIKQTNTALIIYSAGLAYSAVIRIISALRKTAFVVIR